MSILAPDWLEQINAEQKQRSAELMHAALGSDWQVVDRQVERCNQLDEVRRFALLLADACQRAGWGLAARPTFGPLDEG